MMKVLIKNGRVIDPASKLDKVSDLLIEDGKIAEIKTALSAKADQIIDAKGCFVMPGFIDLHTHLRDRGAGCGKRRFYNNSCYAKYQSGCG